MKTIACLLGLAVIIAGCDRDRATTPQPAAPAQAPAATPATVSAPPPASPVAPEAQAPAKPWPPASAADVALADDLTALNYYVIFDGSGSMSQRGCSGERSKWMVAKEALASFARTLPARANLGLLAFDAAGVSERLSLGAGNRAGFVEQVNATTPDGQTPLRRAITAGYRALTRQAQRQLGYGEYHLVVVTDGKPKPATEDPASIVREILADSPVVLHTIGFCIDASHVLNQPGRTIYRAANDPQQLREGLQAVLAEAASFDPMQF